MAECLFRKVQCDCTLEYVVRNLSEYERAGYRVIWDMARKNLGADCPKRPKDQPLADRRNPNKQ